MRNGVDFKRLYDSHGPVEVCRVVGQCLLEGKLKSEDFSLMELAKTFCGEQWYESLRPRNNGGFQPLVLLENEAVDTSAFQNILGQVVFNRILESYREAGNEVDQFIRTEQTGFLTEKIFGMTPILGDFGEHVVHEGEPYPEFGFGEDWIQTPETEKRGGIVSITRELIFFDRTNQALRRAREVGTALGYNRRLRWMDVAIGFVNNYNRQGTVYNTYLTTGAWINKKTGIELIDDTDIDEAMQLFGEQVEPYNDRPLIPPNPNTIIVMPPKVARARSILAPGTVTEITNSGTREKTTNNPWQGAFTVFTSFLWYSREKLRNPTNAATRWYMGDPREAFAYYENWAVGVRVQGSDSNASFERDIEIRYRADERGIAGVENPRAMAQLGT